MSDATPHLPARFERILADYERRLRILENRIGIIGGESTWTYITTFPTFANATITTASGNPLRYRKDANGYVHLAGGLTLNVTSGFVSNATLFTMPASYRPGGSGTGLANNTMSTLATDGSPAVLVRLFPTGEVKFDKVYSGSQVIELATTIYLAEN
jgi:hypothetical protein